MPWSTERPGSLEMMSRMLVRGNYREPSVGTGTRPGLQPADIAAAVGMMADPLQREVATAVAMRAPVRQLGKLVALAYPVIEQQAVIVGLPLSIHSAGDRFRLRLVVSDAVQALVWPEHVAPVSERAREAKMRRADYEQAFALAMSVLEQALSEGCRAFGRALWGRD